MLKNRAEIKRRLIKRDGLTCALCAFPMTAKEATIDHKIASTRGGNDEEINLQLAHGKCNGRKGNRDIEVFPAPEYYDGREYVFTLKLNRPLMEHLKQYCGHYGVKLTDAVRFIILNLPDSTEKPEPEQLEREYTRQIEDWTKKRDALRTTTAAAGRTGEEA